MIDRLLQNQLKAYQKANNWLGIVQLLKDFCRPGQWGWNDGEALSTLGFAHTQLGNFQEAKALYQRWIEVEPDRARTFYCLGYVYYLEEDWREAIFWFQQALKAYPDYLVCLYRLAYVYFKSRKLQESIPLLERALEVYRKQTDEDWKKRQRKTYIKVRFLQARCYYQRRRFREALEHIQAVLADDQKNVISLEHKYYALGKILAALKRGEEALGYLEKALNPDFPQPYVLDQIGRVYHQLGRFAQALDTYGRALKIRRQGYILRNRAETYLAQGKVGKALGDLHEALKRDAKSRHKIYLRLGQIALNQEKLTEARHYFESAIRAKQEIYGADYAEAHYALVFCYLKQDDRTGARKALQAALAADPNLEWDPALANLLEEVPQKQEAPPEEPF